MEKQLRPKFVRMFRCSEKISLGDNGVYYDDYGCNNMTVNMYLCPPLKIRKTWAIGGMAPLIRNLGTEWR